MDVLNACTDTKKCLYWFSVYKHITSCLSSNMYAYSFKRRSIHYNFLLWFSGLHPCIFFITVCFVYIYLSTQCMCVYIHTQKQNHIVTKIVRGTYGHEAIKLNSWDNLSNPEGIFSDDTLTGFASWSVRFCILCPERLLRSSHEDCNQPTLNLLLSRCSPPTATSTRRFVSSVVCSKHFYLPLLLFTLFLSLSLEASVLALTHSTIPKFRYIDRQKHQHLSVTNYLFVFEASLLCSRNNVATFGEIYSYL